MVCGAMAILDTYQSAGIIPVDVEALGVDRVMTEMASITATKD